MIAEFLEHHKLKINQKPMEAIITIAENCSDLQKLLITLIKNRENEHEHSVLYKSLTKTIRINPELNPRSSGMKALLPNEWDKYNLTNYPVQWAKDELSNMLKSNKMNIKIPEIFSEWTEECRKIQGGWGSVWTSGMTKYCRKLAQETNNLKKKLTTQNQNLMYLII